jgi:hypothetical protein
LEEVEMSLEMLKSVLTTVVLALALVQALGMGQVRGYVRLVPLESGGGIAGAALLCWC